jgi:molybdenum cofactor synthesis domain-containing protein
MDDGALRCAILTVSDRSSAGLRPDLSGPQLEERMRAPGWSVVRLGIVPDEEAEVARTLTAWADSGDIDLILTTGGTGFSPRDRTPEATRQVVDRLAPGLAEAMRTAGLQATAHAMLSRAVAGIRGATLIVNLPGSPKAARESLDVILPVLPHALALLRGDPQAQSGHRRAAPRSHG